MATVARGSSPESHGLPRWVEVVAALAGLLVTSPLLLLAALGIRATSPGPAIFRQERIGRGGRPFTLLKLRTMHPAGGPLVTVGGDRRVTPIGRLLRRTKVDELPQLWNVARGDMSLVGPRPEVSRYVDVADPAWRLVLQARPGLTDPVSLELRDEEALLARFEGDRESFYRDLWLPYKLRGNARYLARRSAWSDVALLARTMLAVIRPARPLPPLPPDLERRLRPATAPSPNRSRRQPPPE